MHESSDSVTQVFRNWKADLVDLTTDNPLLFFRPDRNSLGIVLPAAESLLKQFMASDSLRQFRLVRSASPHESGVIVGREDSGAAGIMLRSLRQRARLALDEQGVHVLYLTFGNLSWTSSAGEAIDSPILILPVWLGRATVFADYTLSLAGRHPDLSFNPALAIKLRQDYEVDLSGIANGGAVSLSEVLEEVRESIADHFDWIVSDVSYLTLLPFSKYMLHEDLERHESEFLRLPVIRAIAGEASALPATNTDTTAVNEEDDSHPTWQVLDADQSQRTAIASVHRGDSVVIQGPPGTGKSQTITNLIAEALGRGNTVLFVSEKKAALNVVAQWLAAVGLSEFCLELHDDAADEAAIVRDLANRTGMEMPRDESIDPRLQSLADLADTEELAKSLRELDDYYEALCKDTTPFGGSTYEVIGQLAHLADAPVVRFDYDPAMSRGNTAAPALLCPGSLLHGEEVETLALPELIRWAGALAEDLTGLERWLFSLQSLEKAKSLGMLPFVDAVRRSKLAPEKWADAFGLQLRTLWLTWRLREAPALSRFVRSSPDSLQERFTVLDQAQLAANAVRLITELRQRQRRSLAESSFQADVVTLHRLASAGGQRSLRRLFKEASTLLAALTPCFLMSPMTVARLLGHSRLRFDVVIFDEASQVLPEDAVGSIGRGRQLVVVGDSKQLPPTSFFQSTVPSGAWRPESLLDACTIAGLPNTWLQWHYRSRHEDLIAFANREFYENQLVTFPSPYQDEDPIDYVYVENGMYDRGGTRTNRVEARRLVDLVVEQVQRDPEASIGIITFSEPQMLAVQEELDLRRRGKGQGSVNARAPASALNDRASRNRMGSRGPSSIVLVVMTAPLGAVPRLAGDRVGLSPGHATRFAPLHPQCRST